MNNTISGKIIAVLQIEKFANSEKRTFVIETEGEHKNQIPFELWKDRVSLVSDANIGQTITVHFDPRGREYNGKWFCSLNCWKIEGLDKIVISNSTTSRLPTPTEAQFKSCLEKVAAETATVETVKKYYSLTPNQELQLQNAVPMNDLPF